MDRSQPTDEIIDRDWKKRTRERERETEKEEKEEKEGREWK